MAAVMRGITLAALAGVLLGDGGVRAAPPRWSGTELSLKHAAGVWSALPSAELTYDPIVLQTISFDPRWRAPGGFHLLGHLALETELTNSDTSVREHQPLLDDAWLQTGVGLPSGASASLRLYLPTSRESWARRRLFSLAPGVAIERVWRAGGVAYHPRAALRAIWHAATEQTAVYDAPSIAGCDPAHESCQELTHSGIRSTLATFVETVGVDAELRPDLTASVEVWFVEGLLYPLSEVQLPGGMTLPSSGLDWRLSNLYALGVDWRPLPRWHLGAGLQTLTPLRAPDGTLRTPFFNRLTQAYLTVSRVF